MSIFFLISSIQYMLKKTALSVALQRDRPNFLGVLDSESHIKRILISHPSLFSQLPPDTNEAHSLS